MELGGSMPHSRGLSNNPFPLSLLDVLTDYIKINGTNYEISLWSLLNSPFSFLLGPNICLRILFSNTKKNLETKYLNGGTEKGTSENSQLWSLGTETWQEIFNLFLFIYLLHYIE